MLLWHTVHDYASIATATVFILAAVTDWLDGYLARRVSAVLCVRAAVSNGHRDDMRRCGGSRIVLMLPVQCWLKLPP